MRPSSFSKDISAKFKLSQKLKQEEVGGDEDFFSNNFDPPNKNIVRQGLGIFHIRLYRKTKETELSETATGRALIFGLYPCMKIVQII